MKNVDVTLFKVESSQKTSYGRVTQVRTTVGKISGILLPITSEAAKKQYGYDENVSMQFFYRGGNQSELKVGNIIEIENGESLVIVHIADYIKLKVILLNKYPNKQEMGG
jgi:hypothetical protein